MRIYNNYIRPFLNHPLNRTQKIRAILRFLKWQFRLRIVSPSEIIAPFIGPSKFLVKKGRTGLTGNLYSGLHEFNDMMFLLHFLKHEDVFFDVGANAGSYSILSSACCQAITHSFEPVPETFNLLRRNKELNGNSDKWLLVNSALGDEESKLLFSADRDTMNSVVNSGYPGTAITVPVTTLSLYCRKHSAVPLLLKVDAEGYDVKVIEGAKEILATEQLQAIIIEGGEERIQQLLRDSGFHKFIYDPFKRILTKGPNSSCNSLYIKDKWFCEQRLSNAAKIRVLSYEI